jgi:predicted nucleic acid-binding protein
VTGPSRGLLDTSVFIAAENGRSLKEEVLPAASAAAHNLPVITQDNNFDLLEGVAGLAIVRV